MGKIPCIARTDDDGIIKKLIVMDEDEVQDERIKGMDEKDKKEFTLMVTPVIRKVINENDEVRKEFVKDLTLDDLMWIIRRYIDTHEI